MNSVSINLIMSLSSFKETKNWKIQFADLIEKFKSLEQMYFY